MKSILTAAVAHKVKRLIVTSSALTMTGELYKPEQESSYDELDFPEPDQVHGYIASKIIQERVCREFVRD